MRFANYVKSSCLANLRTLFVSRHPSGSRVTRNKLGNVNNFVISSDCLLQPRSSTGPLPEVRKNNADKTARFMWKANGIVSGGAFENNDRTWSHNIKSQLHHNLKTHVAVVWQNFGQKTDGPISASHSITRFLYCTTFNHCQNISVRAKWPNSRWNDWPMAEQLAKL